MGRVKQKVLPRPVLFSTQIRPPCPWTMHLEMNRPSPDTPAIVLFQLGRTVKNGFALFIRNAFACIADKNNVVINVVEANDDGPLSGGELQRVVQKITEHLKDARPIKGDRRHT